MKDIIFDRYSIIDVNAVNKQFESDMQKFISDCEQNYTSQLEATAAVIKQNIQKCQIILLAGPSASGKTTTAHKLAQTLKNIGIGANVVSLDDFYLGKELYPKLPDGSYDFESVYALDLDLINKCFKTLLDEGSCYFPRYDFYTGSRVGVDNLIEISDNGVVIVEGIHALNPLLTQSVESAAGIMRIYVSVRTKFMLDGAPVLVPKDIRLMRRMVRDEKFRNWSPEKTLDIWENVLDGERKYINPYRDDVNIKIDSTLDYEPSVFHYYLLPFLNELKNKSVHSERIEQLCSGLNSFKDIKEEFIPADTHLREFIG
ncbi:MAG TPA: hypothetical protein DCP97_05215 [Ruminococcaceae bacterium]|nr:hypothetical protein [Oscillospiraceae bacterium]